jgi:hypothetical protein
MLILTFIINHNLLIFRNYLGQNRFSVIYESEISYYENFK